MRVMIAGIGGASLGTEVAKCLSAADGYEIFGCDISPTAYGLHLPMFRKTYLVDRADYVASVVAACRDAGADWIVPGGEQPMVLLGSVRDDLSAADIRFAGNDMDTVALFSDKAATFRRLGELGVSVPRTREVADASDLDDIGVPCIVKPATGTGGSTMVFFAADMAEATAYVDFIRRSGGRPIAQEYVGIDEGEFTIGVLSGSDGRILSSVALRRSLDSKLSVMSRGRGGIVSSGYSQGYIAPFQDICDQAEHIAREIGSRGPINIQARIRDGKLIPFEINPRFSASTYLRALAGINEVDIYLRHESGYPPRERGPLREGWYLRTLAEMYVAPGPEMTAS